MNRPFAALVLGLLACALWVPLRGRALYAHSDLHGYAVPELALHLSGNHAGGAALWNPHVQLGRPAIHSGGLSQAYWPCRIVAWFVDDPWQAHSLLVLATLALGGLLAWSLFRTLELHPWASAAAALAFAFAPFQAHTALYLTYASGTAWTMGLALACVRLARARTVANGLLLALVVHSSILASYPQQVVWSAWLALALVGALLPPRGARARFLGALAAWGALGVLASAPFLLDLLPQVRDSVRAVDHRSIIRAPQLTGMRQWLAWLGELGDPLLNGRRHFTGEGLWNCSFTPFFGAALLIALVAVRSRLVRWLGAFLGVTLALTFVPRLYLLGVRFGGLSLSPYLPLAAATVPGGLLAAIGLDHCLRVRGGKGRMALALVLPALALTGALASGLPIAGGNVALTLALALGAMALVAPTWPLLATAAVASAFHYGAASLPSASRADIEVRVERVRELVEEIRRRAQDGRFAWVTDTRPLLLEPNTEQLYGLASIHSYDSLAPRRYQAWSERVSARGARFRGRFFEHVEGLERLDSVDFRRADVRVVLAFAPLESGNLRPVARVGRVHLHEVAAGGPRAGWVPLADCEVQPGTVSTEREPSADGVERLASPDERAEFVLAPRSEPGLLWLSQQYHRKWRARGEHDGRTSALTTVLVDDFWQGVLVPPGTTRVTLEFRPWIRWAWMPQLLFALAALGLAVHRATRPRLLAGRRESPVARQSALRQG